MNLSTKLRMMAKGCACNGDVIRADAIARAAVDADRLTEENAKLREMLNKIVSESTAVRATPRNTKAVRDQVELSGYIKHFKIETYLINQSVGLLNQLKETGYEDE